MINETLQFIADKLNEHFRSEYALTEDMTLVNSPTLADGTIPAENNNKVLLTLINLDRNAAKTPISFGYKAAAAQPAVVTKTGNYTLYILVSTCFNDYRGALKHLDSAITYMADNATFEQELPAGAGKIELSLEQADGLQMRSIWLALGARYQPSVIYKISITAASAPAVTETQN